MGIGGALAFWAVIAGTFATGLAIVLTIGTWSTQRLQGRVRWRSLLVAVLAPYALVLYFAIGFLAYATWCEKVRGVDPGIGDYWRVPLVNKYALLMIDSPEQVSIEQPDGSKLNLFFMELGVAEPFIAGRSGRHEYFVLDTRDGGNQTWESEEELRDFLDSAGVPDVALRHPFELYRDLRWGWPDAAAVSVLLLPLVLAGVLWLLRFFRSRGPGGRATQPRTAL